VLPIKQVQKSSAFGSLQNQLMHRKFLSSLGLLLFLNLLIKPFWILGIDRAVQNSVSPADYGLYYALFNFSFLFNILLDLGITNLNNKNIAQNHHILNKHLSSIITLRLLLGIFYFIATLFVGIVIGYSTYQILLLCVFGCNQFLISFILYLRSNLSGLHLFKTDSFISVLDRLIMIGICASLLANQTKENPFKIEYYIFAQTFSYILTIVITLFIVAKKAKLKKLVWNKKFSIAIIKKSYPYAILVLLMTFYNRIDSVMIERLCVDGAKEASKYAAAYRLLDAGNMIAYLFAGLLLPMFSRMIKKKEKLEELIGLSFSILIFISLSSASIGLLFRNELMGLLYKHEVEDTSAIFGILIFCFVFVSCTYVYGTLLTANGNLKTLNTMALIGMLVNIGLNLILIPKFNSIGAAYSSLITQASTAIIQLFLAHKILKLKMEKWYWLNFLLFVATLFCVEVFIKSNLFVGHFIWQLLVLVVLIPLIAILTKFIRIFSIYRAFKFS
jgi:O-antigen/teichoic acid export membrane protein